MEEWKETRAAIEIWDGQQFPVPHISHTILTYPVSSKHIPYHSHISHAISTYPVPSKHIPCHFHISHAIPTYPVLSKHIPCHSHISQCHPNTFHSINAVFTAIYFLYLFIYLFRVNSHINFQEDLYLGGYTNMSRIVTEYMHTLSSDQWTTVWHAESIHWGSSGDSIGLFNAALPEQVSCTLLVLFILACILTWNCNSSITIIRWLFRVYLFIQGKFPAKSHKLPRGFISWFGYTNMSVNRSLIVRDRVGISEGFSDLGCIRFLQINERPLLWHAEVMGIHWGCHHHCVV